MTIMTKKLQAGDGLPAPYKTLNNQLIDVYAELTAHIEDSLSRQTDQQSTAQTRILVSAVSFDEVKQAVTGLLFAAGTVMSGTNNNTKNGTQSNTHNSTGGSNTSDPACQILIEISPNLAKSMINAKLGEAAIGQTSFSLFDSLLMQPMAKLVVDGLNVLSGGLTSADIISRSISMDGFQDVNFARGENWVKLLFPIALKANEDRQDQAGKHKVDISNNDDLYLTLYMARPIADTLIGNLPNPDRLAVVDLDDPWSRHMYNTVLGARRSLEIVIEDLNFSVADCTRLEPGQIISLPGASHERLKVKTRSADGNIVLAGATLGAFKANKAVKLNEDIDPAFKGGLENITYNN